LARNQDQSAGQSARFTANFMTDATGVLYIVWLQI